MADIIQLKVMPRPAGGKAGKSKKSAEVIIFPGIRIEREKFSLADRLRPSSIMRGGSKASRPKHGD